jgi:hypothetical protein
MKVDGLTGGFGRDAVVRLVAVCKCLIERGGEIGFRGFRVFDLLGGPLSPRTAEQNVYCASATCPTICPKLRTVSAGLYA